jgi:peptidyl-prolyl cis-trans isomerase C
MSYDRPRLIAAPTERTIVKTLTLTIASLVAPMLVTPAAIAQDKPVLPQPAAIAATRAALVNGKAVPRSRVETVVKQQVAQGAPDGDQLRKAVVDRLIALELINQEADRRGLTKSTEFRDQMEITRQEIILNLFMQEYFKTRPINEATIRAEYEKAKSARTGNEYKVRHILVDSEAEAKGLIAQMNKGGKIEDLAKASKDPGSKDRGGDLGWALPGTYVKPFADALGKLEKGKYTTEPVQSQFGWHVIQVEDVRSTNFPPLDQVRPQIQNALQQQELQKVIADLRAKAKIE